MCLSVVVFAATSSLAQTDSAPVVGGAVLAVNVDVVATTGYRASRLLNSFIYNAQGEKVGSIDDIIIGSDAKVSVAVVSVGGFLGVGDRKVVVPATLFETNEQGQTVLPNATKDALQALPAFRYAK